MFGLLQVYDGMGLSVDGVEDFGGTRSMGPELRLGVCGCDIPGILG